MAINVQSCTEITIKKDDRIYALHVPMGATYPELHCVAHELLAHTTEKVHEISQAAMANAPKVIQEATTKSE